MAAGVMANAQTMPASVVGAWKIVKILPTSNTPCWDAARAKTLVGTTLRFSAHKLTYEGGEIAITETLTRTLSARKFQDEYKFELTSVGVKGGTVQELDLQHEDADFTGATTEVPGDTVLLAGPGRIVVSACGVFYSAVRVGGR